MLEVGSSLPSWILVAVMRSIYSCSFFVLMLPLSLLAFLLTSDLQTTGFRPTATHNGVEALAIDRPSSPRMLFSLSYFVWYQDHSFCSFRVGFSFMTKLGNLLTGKLSAFVNSYTGMLWSPLCPVIFCYNYCMYYGILIVFLSPLGVYSLLFKIFFLLGFWNRVSNIYVLL